jgi:hypothetical protein
MQSYQACNEPTSWGPGPLGPRTGGVGASAGPHKRFSTEVYVLSAAAAADWRDELVSKRDAPAPLSDHNCAL